MFRYAKKRQSIGLLAELVFLIFMPSCIGVKQGCRCDEPKRHTIPYPMFNQELSRIIHHRDSLFQVSKKMIEQLEAEKRTKGNASASGINRTYQLLGQQIDLDQKLENLWCKVRLKTDSTKRLQQICAAHLLVSAANYERIYISSSFGRSFERGDRGNRIPGNILSRNLKLLYSPTNRNHIFKNKLPSGSDSINLMLPKPNLFKSVYYTMVPIGGYSKYIAYNTFQLFGSMIFRHSDPQPVNRKQERKLARQIIDLLEPFDIIVTKSPEYLTNGVIPGYFTHAAIWLGPHQLNRRGAIPRRESKRTDRKITIRDKYLAESITSGVHMGNLKESIDNPVTLIIRYNDLTPELQQRILQNIANQKGKKYDFYFDFESPDRVNCTEMVFLAFDFINWKMDLVLDNWVIYPDNIVKTALRSNHFKMVAISNNGLLNLNPEVEVVKKLIAE